MTVPDTDIASTRTASPVGVLSTQQDADVLAPAHLPSHTHLTGTGMAAPHVVGTAAGIMSLMLDANPALTPFQIKEKLVSTATNLPKRES